MMKLSRGIRGIRFCERHQIPIPPKRAIYGFFQGRKNPLFTNWMAQKLRFDDAKLPEIFADGGLVGGYSSREYWLDGEQVLLALREDVSDLLLKGTVESMGVPAEGKRKGLMRPAEKKIELRPRATIFSAGPGNQTLLEMMKKEDHALREQIAAKPWSGVVHKVKS